MRTDELGGITADGFTRFLLVDILHGTDLKESDVYVESWSLDNDLGNDPKTTGTVRIVHESVHGESWMPTGARDLLSPFRATLQLTEVIQAGAEEHRVPLGLFDVTDVPYAEDVTAEYGARWDGSAWVYTNVTEVVTASIVELDVRSLDGRVLDASFRSPRRSATGALEEWRAIGLLPVTTDASEVTVPEAMWPAENGSRLDAVQTMARALGGVPVVDSDGQWTLIDENTPTVALVLGESGTVVDVSSQLTLDGFANVVIGSYETEDGEPLSAQWIADGDLSPEQMGKEFVAYDKSDTVRTQAEAVAAVAAKGALCTSQEVDYDVTCVYDPLLEIGDQVTVTGGISGVAVKVSVSDAATMSVVVRSRRFL